MNVVLLFVGKGQVEQVIEQVVGKSPTKLETGASLDIGAVQTSEKRPPSPAAPTVAPGLPFLLSFCIWDAPTVNPDRNIVAEIDCILKQRLVCAVKQASKKHAEMKPGFT